MDKAFSQISHLRIDVFIKNLSGVELDQLYWALKGIEEAGLFGSQPNIKKLFDLVNEESAARWPATRR